MKNPGAEPLGEQYSFVFLFMGITLVVLGMITAFAAVFSNFITVVVLGCILIAAGIAQLIHTFRARGRENMLLNVLSSLLYLITGGIVLYNPIVGALGLTLLMAAYFFAAGVIRCVKAVQHRKESGWGWLLFGGIVNIVLAMLITVGWPVTAFWVIGLFVGIELFMNGVAIIALSAAIPAVEKVSSDKPISGPSPGNV
jgi:uncharacterized membrane protein HdeD (DUF308 family)